MILSEWCAAEECAKCDGDDCECACHESKRVTLSIVKL